MTPAADLAQEDGKPSTAPILTWIGAAMAPLFVIPSVWILTRGTELGGPVARLVGYAFYACPLTGYLLLTLASGRKERAEPLRWVLVVLYVLWLIVALVFFVMGRLG